MAGILHVCTANVIRSPMAELLTRHILPDCPVDSAGLTARPGQPIWPAAAKALERRGVHATGFTATRLMPGAAARADLVLTASRRLRDAALTDQPRLLGHVFTWRELAWLVEDLAPDDVPGDTVGDRLRALPHVVGAHRGPSAAPPADALDVPDPLGRPPAAVDQTLAAIESALRAVLTLLGPVADPVIAMPDQVRAG